MADDILPHALPGALDGRNGIKPFSPDCFDTLLRRDTRAPMAWRDRHAAA